MKVLEPKKKEPTFPKIKVVGGPHGKNIAIDLDGESMKGLTRAEVVVDAQDAVRVTVFRVLEVDIDVTGLLEKQYRAKVYVNDINFGTDTMDRTPVVAAVGSTTAEALMAAANILASEKATP